MPKPIAKTTKPSLRRSPCPVSCTLHFWRPLDTSCDSRSHSREESLQRFPRFLTERLKRLLEHRVVIQVSATEGSKHLAYQFTEKGDALLPIVKAMKDWGLTWEKSTRAGMA